MKILGGIYAGKKNSTLWRSKKSWEARKCEDWSDRVVRVVNRTRLHVPIGFRSASILLARAAIQDSLRPRQKDHYYTPDFEVHRGEKKKVVEVKSQPQVDSRKFDIIFRAATSACADDGYEYVIATDKMIRQQPKLDNIKKLWKYARTPILPQHQLLAAEIFQVSKIDEVELGDLLTFFKSKNGSLQVVYAMLFWGILTFDLTHPLSEFTPIKMTGFSAALIRKAS